MAALLVVPMLFAALYVMPRLGNPWEQIWRDDFSYKTLEEMGNYWAITMFSDGSIRLENGVLILNDPTGHAQIQHTMAWGPDDWAVEGSGAWTGGKYCGLNVAAYTEKRSYEVVLNGSSRALTLTTRFEDLPQTTEFGGYAPDPNVTISLRMEKVGRSIHLYCNSRLVGSYYESEDTGQLTRVGIRAGQFSKASYDFLLIQVPSGLTWDVMSKIHIPPETVSAMLQGLAPALVTCVFSFLMWRISKRRNHRGIGKIGEPSATRKRLRH